MSWTAVDVIQKDESQSPGRKKGKTKGELANITEIELEGYGD